LNFQSWPKSVLVAVVLFVGVLSLFVLRRPHSVCDSQLELFSESQKGRLYPVKVKSSLRPPLLPKLIENCKMGNSPGACFELFSNMRAVLRDVQNIPTDCGSTVAERGEITGSLLQTAQLMARVAWGEAPPSGGAARFNWFEASDLALFCGIRDQYTRLVGADAWDEFRLATHKKLPGEAPVIVNGVCQNCENRKTADQLLPAEEIWAKSVFSVRCEQYR
jgi:hypothetical protein